MTLNAQFILKCTLRTAHLTYMYVRCHVIVAFGFDHTHRCSQRGRKGSGLEGLGPLLPLCGQLTRCFSAVAELLVKIMLMVLKVIHFYQLTVVVFLNFTIQPLFFTARCYAERGYEIACRLSVYPSVRPSHLSTVIT